jgi:hypothetical protein
MLPVLSHCVSISTGKDGLAQWTNSHQHSPFWEATNCSPTQEFSKSYGTRRFITMFTRARHWSLSWARSVQSIPLHSVYLWSNIVLFFYLQWCLPKDFFVSGSPKAKTLFAFLFSHACYMPCPIHPPWVHHSNYTWRKVQVMKLLIVPFSLFFYYFFPLGPKYSPLFPNTINLCKGKKVKLSPCLTN